MILFRVDATPQIGAGHLMRCLALSQAWRHTGGQVVFASPGRLEVDPAERIAAPVGTIADAEQTAAIAKAHNAEWVVVDGYQFGSDYQDAIKAAGHRLLVIDDHGRTGRYSADLVLDQNAGATATVYPHCASHTRLLLGSRFVLLRAEFAKWRSWRREIAARARRVLVTFGGADPVNATSRVIDALAPLEDIQIVAVAGTQNHNPLPALPQVRVERGVNDMPQLISECDLAVTAAGSTCWELALLQTPMLVMPIADNQRPIAKALAARGAAVDLGWHEATSHEEIVTATRELIANPDRRRTMADAGRTLIDGEGAGRVVAHMKKALVSLRRATEADCRLVWEWANEPGVRAVSFRSQPISWESHVRWFEAQLRDSQSAFYIAENERPIGQARFAIAADGVATISTSLDASARGRGLGSAVILAACERLFAETAARRVLAFIKPENRASIIAFTRAEFIRAADVEIEGQIAAQCVLEREFP